MTHPENKKRKGGANLKRLVERAQRGDTDAQQQLWRDHARWVAAIVLAHRPRAIEVDDLMQDVAVKMVSKIDTLRDAAAFRPWMRQIILNVCRGAARKLRPTLHLATAGEMRDDDASSAIVPPEHNTGRSETLVDRQEAADRLLEQLETLPPEYREPLLLRCVRSMTYQQISDVLELPVTTIETRLARARKMLREEVGEQVTPDGIL